VSGAGAEKAAEKGKEIVYACILVSFQNINIKFRGKRRKCDESLLSKDVSHEADKGKGFGECNTEEHGGSDHASSFWLAGHCLDGLAD
jgi:hypothetical protein